MKKKLNEILLVDDSAGTNILHKRILERLDVAEKIVIATNGKEALDYIKSDIGGGLHPRPQLIFLDVNMPVMDGFQFLDAYQNLDESYKSEVVLIMLTTSLSPEDEQRAQQFADVKGYIHKPLSKVILDEIMEEYF